MVDSGVMHVATEQTALFSIAINFVMRTSMRGGWGLTEFVG